MFKSIKCLTTICDTYLAYLYQKLYIYKYKDPCILNANT